MTPSESEFEEAVRRWHESGSDEPLHVWLGLSWDEYARLVESPSPLESGQPPSP